jgi:hypothetical protein
MVEVKVRFFSEEISKNKIIFSLPIEKKGFRKKFKLYNLRFLLKFLDKTCEIVYKDLCIVEKKKFKFNKNAPLLFFLRSSLRILKSLLSDIIIFKKVPFFLDECQKYLYKCAMLSEKFFEKNQILSIFSKKTFSLSTGKITTTKNETRNSKLLKKTHNISKKKNSFLESEMEVIYLFISNNLGKLTSTLDLNLTAHSELIEQVSDHSIDIQTSSKKIRIKLRSIKNIRKNFTFFENKIFCFIWISFILCYFL